MARNINENKLGVALTKNACPICNKVFNGDIIMNKLLTETMAQKVDKLHGKVIGYEICEECKELKSKGFILVGIVKEKTDDMQNPYKSGNIWVISNDYAKRLYGENVPKQGFGAIDINDAIKIGLPSVNKDA